MVKKEPIWKNYFRNKKITMLGLGVLGRGIGVADFLARHGARLLVTDLKDKNALTPALKKLKLHRNIRYVLGKHRLEDFRNCDMVIKAAGVPLDSPYIALAKHRKIPVEMDTSLFLKLAPKINFIGVTGTRGKTTTTFLIHEILKKARKHVFLAGNIKGIATLPLLEGVRAGDYVVAELDSWQLQGFGDAKISPPVAVFTTFLPDHLNYYRGRMSRYFKDKANIFRYQKKGNFFIAGSGLGKYLPKKPKAKLVIARSSNVPRGWKIKIPGEHNKLNVACALAAARALGIPDRSIKSAVERFRGVPGRLELVREWHGVKFYNDTTATTPDATIAALKALSRKRNVVLIVGGADKKLDIVKISPAFKKYCKSVVLLPGSGTDRLKIKAPIVGSMDKAVKLAAAQAKKGDIVLLSPGFASFGLFKNEYDRGDQFSSLVKKLK